MILVAEDETLEGHGALGKDDALFFFAIIHAAAQGNG